MLVASVSCVQESEKLDLPYLSLRGFYCGTLPGSGPHVFASVLNLTGR